jgi:hypothetical protein
MIQGFQKVENPTFVLTRFGHNCPLGEPEITWLLRHKSWHLSTAGETIHSPFFDAKIARIDRINNYANKVFLEGI